MKKKTWFPGALLVLGLLVVSCQQANNPAEEKSTASILVKNSDVTLVEVTLGDQTARLVAGESRQLTLTWKGTARQGFPASYWVQATSWGSTTDTRLNFTQYVNPQASYTYTFSSKTASPYFEAIWVNDATPVLDKVVITASKTTLTADGVDAVTFTAACFDQFGQIFVPDAAPGYLVDGLPAASPYSTLIPGEHSVTTAWTTVDCTPVVISATEPGGTALYSATYTTPSSAALGAADAKGGLVVAASGKSVLVWTADSPVSTTVTKSLTMPATVTDLVLSTDGTTLLVALGDDTLRQYSMATGAELLKVSLATSSTNAVAASIDVAADGSKVACALGPAGHLLVFRLADGSLVKDIDEGSNVGDVSFNPLNSDEVVYGQGWGSVKVVQLGQGTTKTLGQLAEHAVSVDWSADGRWVAASTPYEVFIWDRSNGDTVVKSRNFAGMGPDDGYGGFIQFSPDSTRLVFGPNAGESNRIITEVNWATAEGTALTTAKVAHETVLFGEDGRLVVGQADQGLFRLASDGSGTLTATYQGVSTGAVAALQGWAVADTGASAFSDGRRIVVWNSDGTLQRILAVPAAFALALSPDGTLLVCKVEVNGQSKVQLWDLTTGTLRKTIDGSLARSGQIRFTADGASFLVSGDQSMVRYASSTGIQQAAASTPVGMSFGSFSLSPDGTRMAAMTTSWGSSNPASLQLWSWTAPDAVVEEAALSLDKGYFGSRACVMNDGTVVLGLRTEGQSTATALGVRSPEGSLSTYPMGSDLTNTWPQGLELLGTQALLLSPEGTRVVDTTSGGVQQVLAATGGNRLLALATSPGGNHFLVSSAKMEWQDGFSWPRGDYQITIYTKN